MATAFEECPQCGRKPFQFKKEILEAAQEFHGMLLGLVESNLIEIFDPGVLLNFLMRCAEVFKEAFKEYMVFPRAEFEIPVTMEQRVLFWNVKVTKGINISGDLFICTGCGYHAFQGVEIKIK